MYMDYYGLKSEPFHITPDSERLFLSPGHKDAIGTILYGLGARKGFMAVTGDAGAGKTTVLRYCLARLPETYDIVYVLQPALPPSELLCLIYRELVGKRASRRLIDRADGISEVVAAIHAHLFKVFDRGRSVVIVIDEAQNMPIQTLESLRVLSNLETDTEKLLQIVLVGQSELNDKLARHEMRQLDQRIAVRTHIPVLTTTEAKQYIEHRLSVVGRTTAELFTPQAVSVILRAAGGNARRINVLCDNALMNGFGHNSARVTGQIAREVAEQLHDRTRRHFSLRRWLLAPATWLFDRIAAKKEAPTLPITEGHLAVAATLPDRRYNIRRRSKRPKPKKKNSDALNASLPEPTLPKAHSAVPNHAPPEPASLKPYAAAENDVEMEPALHSVAPGDAPPEPTSPKPDMGEPSDKPTDLTMQETRPAVPSNKPAQREPRNAPLPASDDVMPTSKPHETSSDYVPTATTRRRKVRPDIWGDAGAQADTEQEKPTSLLQKNVEFLP